MHSRVRVCCRNHAESRGKVGGPGAPGAKQRHPEVRVRLGYPLVYRLKKECYSLFPESGGGERGGSLFRITGTVLLPLDGIVAEVSNHRSRSQRLSILENVHNTNET